MMMSFPRFLFISILYVFVLAAAHHINGVEIHDEFGREASRLLLQKFTVDRENREISGLEELITSMSMSMDMGLEKRRKATIPPVASSNVYQVSSLSSSTNTAFEKSDAPSIDSITFDSDSLPKELTANAIVSTTVADISDDIELSNSAAQVSPIGTLSSIKVVMIVCFSLAAIILI
ncbi:hypothetical protein FRACYDRAFT_234912 [Fragilariopsis cylindrus CCMP1102]|uniref:Uncharacterized protein n=1 Tax=Fragilariopsis cylindrus CCMP1102 TaxID=635003 RepID=A0A1E7FT45_9STRA|nr:hypothetical protein FRACYDRAFT_234912 [Fragilariopsis cylindrus CCMP1102]|eukprot:OEU21284.1 hypothetical protein FRACYDRAFT_234912 [Fragilariopsis cylindrus CCMP1102]